MADKYTESLFEIADVTGSTVAANGEIRVNLGDGGTGAGIDADVPILGSYGFSARPPSPDANGAAQAFFVRDGNVRRVLATRDRRWLASSLGQRDEGDVAVWTRSGARVLIDDSSGSIEMRTAGGAMFLLTDDEFSISFPNGAILTLNASEFDVSIPTTPDVSSFTINALGVVLAASNTAQQINLDAGFVTLGLNVGNIRPVQPVNGVVTLGAGPPAFAPSIKVVAAI